MESTSDNQSTSSRRLVVISNRLPVSIARAKDGTWSATRSSGGLVAALSALSESMEFVWIGWTGAEVAEEEQDDVRAMLWEQQRCVPVFLPETLADDFYNGFSNGILWPLFHYLPSDVRFEENLWDAYQTVNDMFAEVVCSMMKDGDLVWIHDYHLMLLPERLRDKFPLAVLGFFLHIPFPSSDMYRMLPVREELLIGVLHCDLVGFHTYEYGRHFLAACTRVLGFDTTPTSVFHKGREVSVGVFPVGISPETFRNKLAQENVRTRLAELRNTIFKDKKVLLGVDRLDYIKGIPQKLLAFELFLKENPEWQDKVVLVQIAVPSRTEVEAYSSLKSTVEQLVGRINGTMGSLTHNPVHYLFQSVPLDELVPLYAVTDVMMITSTRDGMNLVAQEYIACQSENKGILILSEFAGFASAVDGPLVVNPWDIEGVACALRASLTIPAEDRRAKFAHLEQWIDKHTAVHWGNSFVQQLQQAASLAAALKAIPPLSSTNVKRAFDKATTRLILLACDGTLLPFRSARSFAAPTPHTLRALHGLSRDPRNLIVIVSNREKNDLARWFGDLPRVALVAESGCLVSFRPEGGLQWEQSYPDMDMSWKEILRPVFEHFAERTPGSYVQVNDFNIAWHYENAVPDFASWQSREVQLHLETFGKLPAEFVSGHKSLEARPSGVNIKHIIKQLVDRGLSAIEFVLQLGDPEFCCFAPPENAISFVASVGEKHISCASHLRSVAHVSKLLDLLVSDTDCIPLSPRSPIISRRRHVRNNSL